MPKTLNEQMTEACARSEIASLHDDTTLTAELSALYLCVSPQKLEEWRAGGGGPAFVKTQDSRAAGRSQPVYYKLGVLRAFTKRMMVEDTLEVSRRELRAFTTTAEPFWMKESRILGSALETEKPTWGERFTGAVGALDVQANAPAVSVVWITPMEASQSGWRDAEARAALVAEIDAAFARAQAHARMVFEDTEFWLAIGAEGPMPPRRSRPS